MNAYDKLYKAFETQRKVLKLLDLRDKFKPFPNSMDRLNELTGRYSELANGYSKAGLLSERLNSLSRFDQVRKSSSLEILRKLSVGFSENPEVQYITISELELLSATASNELAETFERNSYDNFVSAKEEILEEYLLPYLERLGVDSLWLGANFALKSVDNPDRLRHTLVSLRTLLEYLIEVELAPHEELSQSNMFTKEFNKVVNGKKPQIKRWKKVKYFTSKIQFGLLEEFTEKDINLICECYDVLCNLHQPNIQLNENQVRVLKVKTGILLWLLAYINEIIKGKGIDD
jgi:hypothetical protein